MKLSTSAWHEIVSEPVYMEIARLNSSPKPQATFVTGGATEEKNSECHKRLSGRDSKQEEGDKKCTDYHQLRHTIRKSEQH